MIADHGAFNAAAQPSRTRPGFFSVFTGSYDVEAAHCRVTGAFTNKAPGGVAYSCSFRIAEAVYLVERLVDCLARELDRDPVELRRQNLIRPEQFPYASKTGWVYDSGDYEAALDKALGSRATTRCAREQREKRARGELMGIGVSFFTEAVGAGPRKHMDMLGLGMNDGAAIRMSPDRHRAGRDQRPDPGAGARDDVRADRRPRARARPGRRRGHPRRHGQHALRARHVGSR